MQCSSCAAVYLLARVGFEWYNKKLIKTLLLALKEELLDDPTPWACVACNRCTEVCPRLVSPFEVMFAVRRMMVEEFAIPTLANLKTILKNTKLAELGLIPMND